MDDIAAVAARALVHDRYVGEALALTGPEVLSRVELVRELGQALGREPAFVASSRDETVAALEPVMGENAGWYVDTVLAGFAAADRPAPTTAVQDVAGRPATPFARWAARNAARFLA